MKIVAPILFSTKVDIETAKADIGNQKWTFKMQKADIENVKSATAGGTIDRVLMSFAKLP